MSNKPVWMLDVDGVINIDQMAWGGLVIRRTAYSNSTPHAFKFSADLVNRIREIIHSQKVEVRWLTTWAEEANQLERMFGWPVLTRALPDEDCTADQQGIAKIREVLKVINEEKRPLIWTDDQWAYPENLEGQGVPPRSGGLHEQIEAAYANDPGRLLIAPKSRIGLLPGHLDMIELWLIEQQEIAVTRLIRQQVSDEKAKARKGK